MIILRSLYEINWRIMSSIDKAKAEPERYQSFANKLQNEKGRAFARPMELALSVFD